ncbi:MAG: C40 family peptidase [Nitrospira sp.]|nr:NlpC/P60 family protein [Candidatus Manganitrophaceae bacterium]HIL33896.1 NlpC/P60 family protein [Candidatus Manganitrophaceae bacterium]
MRTLSQIAWTSFLLIALTACGSAPRAAAFPQWTSDHRPPTTQARKKIVQTAHTLVGVPYLFGGASPKGFDCSGLINYVFRQAASLDLPRTTRQLIRIGEAVRKNELSPGDLVFFRIGQRRSIHIGIYIGNGEFIHAPKTGGEVNIQRLSTQYWKTRYRGARSIL